MGDEEISVNEAIATVRLPIPQPAANLIASAINMLSIMHDRGHDLQGLCGAQLTSGLTVASTASEVDFVRAVRAVLDNAAENIFIVSEMFKVRRQRKR